MTSRGKSPTTRALEAARWKMSFTPVQGALWFLKSQEEEQRDRTPLPHPSCPTLPAPASPALFLLTELWYQAGKKNGCKFSTLRQTGLLNKLDHIHIIAFGQHLFGGFLLPLK